MNEDSNMWKTLKILTKDEIIDPEHIGLDSRFFLLSHYELVMPGTYKIDHSSGNKVWSEPALVLIISVDHPDLSSLKSHKLFYGLSRSYFQSGTDPIDEDRQKLMTAVLPILKMDIERIAIVNSDLPDSLPKTKFVMP